MYSDKQIKINRDMEACSIRVSDEFEAPLQLVWRSYTDPGLLDLWWGPSPWRAETKEMNFTPGGHWLYAMVSPENQKHWGRMDFLEIEPYKSFGIRDVFCDEDGNVNAGLPASKGRVTFYETGSGTSVDYINYYSSPEEIQKITEMGFETGITICYNQLKELLRKLQAG